MTIRVASWNVEGRLSPRSPKRRGAPRQILEGIDSLKADLVVLPEAFDEAIGTEQGVEDALVEMGYTVVFDTPYEEGGPGRISSGGYKPVLRVLSREAILCADRFRLGDLRNMAHLEVVDPGSGLPLSLYAIHLDERSAELRSRQLGELSERVENDSNQAQLVIGDMNTMAGRGLAASILRSRCLKSSINLLPEGALKRYAVLASDMADGVVLSNFETTSGLRNVDSSNRPTTTPKVIGLELLPSIPMIDIDHALASSDLEVHDFKVMSRDGGSDHRAISMTVSIVG